jgi:hypothetical protein
MTTTNRMNNFKRLAERLSQGEKLLTTREKTAMMSQGLSASAVQDLLSVGEPRFSAIQLVPTMIEKKNGVTARYKFN